MSFSGLGVPNSDVTGTSGNRLLSSYLAWRLCPVSSRSVHNDDGGSPIMSFNRYDV